VDKVNQEVVGRGDFCIMTRSVFFFSCLGRDLAANSRLSCRSFVCFQFTTHPSQGHCSKR
jgi:hypothetical protein